MAHGTKLAHFFISGESNLNLNSLFDYAPYILSYWFPIISLIILRLSILKLVNDAFSSCVSRQQNHFKQDKSQI